MNILKRTLLLGEEISKSFISGSLGFFKGRNYTRMIFFSSLIVSVKDWENPKALKLSAKLSTRKR